MVFNRKFQDYYTLQSIIAPHDYSDSITFKNQNKTLDLSPIVSMQANPEIHLRDFEIVTKFCYSRASHDNRGKTVPSR